VEHAITTNAIAHETQIRRRAANRPESVPIAPSRLITVAHFLVAADDRGHQQRRGLAQHAGHALIVIEAAT
jgi:hypothetical protein